MAHSHSHPHSHTHTHSHSHFIASSRCHTVVHASRTHAHLRSQKSILNRKIIFRVTLQKFELTTWLLRDASVTRCVLHVVTVSLFQLRIGHTRPFPPLYYRSSPRAFPSFLLPAGSTHPTQATSYTAHLLRTRTHNHNHFVCVCLSQGFSCIHTFFVFSSSWLHRGTPPLSPSLLLGVVFGLVLSVVRSFAPPPSLFLPTRAQSS